MPMYICPISWCIPRVPVITNEGITYDFVSIARNLLRVNTNNNPNFNSSLDPTTDRPIDTLIYNHAAKELNDTLMDEVLPLNHEEKTEIALLYTQLVCRYPALRIYGIHTLEGVQALIGTLMPAIQIEPQRAVIVESLWDAACNGHLPVVTALLAAGAAVNQTNANGATPLFISAQKGHLPVVTALLDAGAAINQAMADGATPLHTAVLFNHFEVVHALLNHQHAVVPHPRMPIATRHRYPAFVKVLLSNEAVRDYYLTQITIKPELMRDAFTQNPVFFTELATYRNEIWARLRGPAHFNLAPDAHKALLKAILNSGQVPDKTQRHPLHALFSAPEPTGWRSFFSRTENIILNDIQAYTDATYPEPTLSIY